MSDHRRRPGVEQPADWAWLGELGYQGRRLWTRIGCLRCTAHERLVESRFLGPYATQVPSRSEPGAEPD
jgi:hypothetical protein